MHGAMHIPDDTGDDLGLGQSLDSTYPPKCQREETYHQHPHIVKKWDVPLVVAIMVILATLVRPRAVLLSQFPMNHTIPHQTATPAVSLTPSLSSGSGTNVGSVRMLDSARDIGRRMADGERLIPNDIRRDRERG